jgi:hypothetical protein
MSLPNNTFASPGNAYFALASEIVGAQDWWQFPSQNGEIQLIDSSGTQLLHSIAGDLFYNNELLAKANDIQDIADWSLYPALASVNMDGQSLTDVSSIVVNNNISTNSLLVTNGITSQANIITPTIQVAGEPIPNLGQITTKTLAVSGAAQAGSVSSTGAIAGGSLATTGGLDMTNSSITRASSVGISNSGFAPYGSLTSPDGVQLTWNGAAITTGSGGNASQWANFPAVTTVNANSNPITNVTTIGASGNITTTANVNGFAFNGTNVEATNIAAGPIGSGKFCIMTNNSITSSTTDGLTISVPSNNLVTTVASGTITNTSTGNINNVSNNFEVTANGGLNPLITPNISLTAQNGNGGQINLVADPGSIAAFGGVVNITGNGGTILIPQPPPAPPTSVTVGGEVNITANTGSGAGLYTLTSAINLNAAAINSYAGAIPSISSLLGYNTVFGNLGVSICAGLPPIGLQFPGTAYIYGLGIPGVAGGVRIQSPQGIQMLSDTYIDNLYPLDGNGLNIQGRSLPTGYVNITDVGTLTMNVATPIQTDRITSVAGFGTLFQDAIQATTIEPPTATAAGTPNLIIKGNTGLIPGSYSNYVVIQNANTIAFDASGSGALSGVQSINGAAWPPPTGDASLWSQYPATSAIDASGYGIINLSTINGQPVGDLTPAGWAAFKAIQNVDMSSNELLNVNDISIIPGATIVGQGALNVDVSGDLQFFTSGGGEINFSTGNAADINITTLGSGNELSLAGDVVNIDGTLGVRISAPYLDMTANNVINVNQLLGAGDGTDLVISNPGTGTVSILDQSGSITVSSQFNSLVLAAGTNINMTCVSGSILQNASVTIGQVGFPKNLTVNGNAYATTDVVSSFGGATPYSLNTIGGLVAGISSAFRDQTEFYVSNDGSDNYVGNILNPFKTVQKAITQAELISSATQICVIHVASGNYVENLVFQKGYVILSGAIQSQTHNEVTELTGSISIALTGADDLNNRQVVFQGFNISTAQFQSVTDTSTASHTVTFQDCKTQINSQFFVSTATCADMRLYMTNVEVQQNNVASSLPVILTNVGLIEFERLDMSISGNASAISITGTSVLNRFSLSTLTISSTAATLAPLLNISSTTTATHSLGNVAFAYTSAVAKTATSAVYIASGIATAIIMLNCVFTLVGTASSTNFCVGYNGVGSPTIAGFANTSLSVNTVLVQTTAVQSGITQIQYTDIQPPGLASYSSTSDQSISVAGTPQALTLNTTQFNQGTTLAAGSRVYANAQGNYVLTYTLNLLNIGVVANRVTTFLKKNGTTIANTGSQSLMTVSGEVVITVENVVSLNAGDYVEVFFNAANNGVSVNATAAAGALPAIPSVVFNIKQIR